MNKPAWQQEMLRIAILYRMEECKDRIEVVRFAPDDYAVVEPELTELAANGLIGIKGQVWVVTDRGRAVLGKILEMIDHILHFEIFRGVRLTQALPPEVQQEDDSNLVQHHIYDPRFLLPGEEDPTAWDLRIAIMTFLSEQMASQLNGQVIDPYRVVFLQKLGTGQFNSKTFWFDLKLGTPFQTVEEIVNSAYQWQDVNPDDVDQAAVIMQTLYQAGMSEQRKRDGFTCSGCGIPLAMFEAVERTYGRELKSCPNPDCGCSFEPPLPQSPELECPNCGGGLTTRSKKCHGCGAYIDRSLAEGTVTTETTEVTTTTWDWSSYGYYGYSPYGYYDPWDPFVNAVEFGCLVAILW